MAEWRERKRKTWLPKLILLLLGAGLVYWLFFTGAPPNKNNRQQAPISITPVVRKDVPVYLTGLGTIQAYNTVTVRTQVDGQLVAVNFTEGQSVKTGDVLAKVDPRTFQASYDQATATRAKDEANLANARLDLQRYINLGTSVSGQTLDTQRATVKQLEATVKADQAAVNSAAAQLSYTTITSPINGRTGIRQVDIGNIVHSADANGIVVVTQLQPISVIFSLPQQSLQAINEQLNAGNILSVDALGEDNKTVIDSGALGLVDNEIDQTTGTIRLKANFPNPKYMLWPGGFTNVRLLLKINRNVLVAPTVAVQRGPQAPYVFIYHPASDNYKPKTADGSEGKSDKKEEHEKKSGGEGGQGPKDSVEMRTVKVNMTTDQDTVIDEGVQPGEQVVVDGMAKLQDGSKVELGQKKNNTAENSAAPVAAPQSNAAAVPPPPLPGDNDKTMDQAAQQKDMQDSSTDSQGEKKHRHKQEQSN